MYRIGIELEYMKITAKIPRMFEQRNSSMNSLPVFKSSQSDQRSLLVLFKFQVHLLSQHLFAQKRTCIAELIAFGTIVMKSTVNMMVEPTRRYHSEENFLYSPRRMGMLASSTPSTLKLMRRMTTPELRTYRMNMFQAEAQTSSGLLCRFSNLVIFLRIVFEMKLTKMMIRGMPRIITLLRTYLGSHYTQYFSPLLNSKSIASVTSSRASKALKNSQRQKQCNQPSLYFKSCTWSFSAYSIVTSGSLEQLIDGVKLVKPDSWLRIIRITITVIVSRAAAIRVVQIIRRHLFFLL